MKATSLYFLATRNVEYKRLGGNPAACHMHPCLAFREDRWQPSGIGALARRGGPLLRSILSVTPRHQFVQPSDFVIGDAAEDIGQPSLGIDAVQLGGLDQRIGDGG